MSITLLHRLPYCHLVGSCVPCGWGTPNGRINIHSLLHSNATPPAAAAFGSTGSGVSVGGPSTGDSLSAVGSVLDVVRMEVHLKMR